VCNAALEALGRSVDRIYQFPRLVEDRAMFGRERAAVGEKILQPLYHVADLQLELFF
jgi:hypothetical protein